jgi:hypothetical protein
MAVSLSLLDYACSFTKTVLFVTMNLLSRKTEALESAYELLEGSVSGVLHVQSSRDTPKGRLIEGHATMRPKMRDYKGFEVTVQLGKAK